MGFVEPGYCGMKRGAHMTIAVSFVAVMGLTLLVGGCAMVGPDFKRPTAPVADEWLEPGNVSIDWNRETDRNWWTVFKDPSLIRLVELAYQQNLTLRTAGVRVLEARAQLAGAIGEFYPQQQVASASVTYNRIPFSAPFNITNNVYWQDSFATQAVWELDFWGKLRRAIESADDAYLASVANYDDALVTLIGDVASDYIQIRTTERQIAIATDNIERQKKALKIATAKFKYGTATKRDVYQAEDVLGATEATVPQLNIQLAQNENALAVLLGLPPGRVDEWLAGASDIPTAPRYAAVGIPADLLRRRPDVRRAELQAAAQCAQIGFAKADLLPTLSLVGSVGTIATDIAGGSLGNVFSSNSLAYSAGPGLQWDFLNYGQITNNVRMQDAKFQESLVDYQNTVLKAQQEVENGIAVFVKSREQAAFLQQSVKAAEGAMRIAMLQYRQGIADFTTVLTAEQNLYQAQNNLAIATGDIALGLIATYRALGGGWQIREGHDFVPAQTRHEMSQRTNWGTLLTPDLLRPQAPGLPSASDVQKPLVRPPEW
jgi:NodT family efflux transporter outer membrane factor (OMF) lipoprotein